MKTNVSLFFQAVIEFWNKHSNTKYTKNLEIVLIFQNYFAGINFTGDEKPLWIRGF